MKWIAVPSVRNYLTKRCPEMVKLQGQLPLSSCVGILSSSLSSSTGFSATTSALLIPMRVFSWGATLSSANVSAFITAKTARRTSIIPRVTRFMLAASYSAVSVCETGLFVIRQSGSKFQLLVQLSFLKCNCLSGKVSNYLWGLQQISSLKWVLKT